MVKKRKLLLVEDEILIALSQKEKLEQYNYQVATVTSGEKAINYIEDHKDTDLILMDINLKNDMDGTEAAQKILEKHNIPILFLSSHSEPAIVEKTEKITSYGYVVKSSSITVLDASIKMAFKLFEANHKTLENENALKIFKALVENASDAICMSDVNGVHIYQNKASDQLLGPIDKNPIQSTYVDKKIGGQVFNTLLSGKEWSGEVEFYDKDKKTRNFLLRGFPIKNQDNQVTNIVGIHTDISEKIEIQKRIKEYQVLLDSIFNSLESMLIVVDKDLKIVMCNFKDHEWVPEAIRDKEIYCYKEMKHLNKPCPYCPPLKTFKDI